MVAATHVQRRARHGILRRAQRDDVRRPNLEILPPLRHSRRVGAREGIEGLLRERHRVDLRVELGQELTQRLELREALLNLPGVAVLRADALEHVHREVAGLDRRHHLHGRRHAAAHGHAPPAARAGAVRPVWRAAGGPRRPRGACGGGGAAAAQVSEHVVALRPRREVEARPGGRLRGGERRQAVAQLDAEGFPHAHEGVLLARHRVDDRLQGDVEVEPVAGLGGLRLAHPELRRAQLDRDVGLALGVVHVAQHRRGAHRLERPALLERERRRGRGGRVGDLLVDLVAVSAPARERQLDRRRQAVGAGVDLRADPERIGEPLPEQAAPAALRPRERVQRQPHLERRRAARCVPGLQGRVQRQHLRPELGAVLGLHARRLVLQRHVVVDAQRDGRRRRRLLHCVGRCTWLYVPPGPRVC